MHKFLKLGTAVCVLSALILLPFCVTSEAGITIGGKSLGSIPDIIKATTGSDLPEIQKHSLLLFERFNDTAGIVYQPRVFTINADGTMRKQFELKKWTLDDTHKNSTTVTPGGDFVQKMDLAISPQRFGGRRNVIYTNTGLAMNNSYYSITGFHTVESKGTEDNASMTNPDETTPQWYWGQRCMWGNAAMTVKGMENQDIFVIAHSTLAGQPGNIYLYFLGVDRDKSGSVSSHHITINGGDQYFGAKVGDFNSAIWGVSVTAGDFDGDGYKNEILLAWNNNEGVYAYVYRITSTDGKTLNSAGMMSAINGVHTGYQNWGWEHYRQSSVIALAGDFDGDGVQEGAVVTKTNGLNLGDMRIKVFKYNSGSWTTDELTAGDNQFWGTLKATKADLNGDGQDEIVVLVLQDLNASTIHPRLEFWGFERGSIKPIRNAQCNKGGIGGVEILGYTLTGSSGAYSQCFKTAEDFSITAGPLTGTKGHIKLADDIAISHVNSDASRVFVIPSVLNDNRDFIAFGDTKKVYEVIGSSQARRGALITSDFANEVLMLGKPYHTIDDIDTTYVTVLQAIPYHVDNVDVNGQLTQNPQNYTFSGFAGDEGNGKMSVTYTKVNETDTSNTVTFNTASTTETISELGDVGPYVQGYLKFRATQANIAGNFDERIKAAGQMYSSILDFVTTKIDNVTESSTKEAENVITSSKTQALIWDTFSAYTAQQHIWRYKILNKPLPSWYKLGPQADYSSHDIDPDNTEHYMTFTLYDTATKVDADQDSTNTYQARHEEGNLFSYPSSLDGIEGYNDKGKLADEEWKAWSKGNDSSRSVQITQSKVSSQGYNDKTEPSELTKTISGAKAIINTVAGWFGADEPFEEENIPDSSTHSETFSKSFATTEKIDIDLYGTSTIPGEDAGYMISSMPFIAREGTLKVAHAVQLYDSPQQRLLSPLWGDDSRYRKLPDPALVLPRKWVRNGATFRATTNNAAAMLMRGLRFRIPALDLYSDIDFVAGLTYEIKVPVYNASFRETGSFNVKLSYANADRQKEDHFDVYNPNSTMDLLTEIGTVSMSLNGWGDNKGWATFTWTVPADMKTGRYLFFAQIDPPDSNPEHRINEVHESRLNADGTVADVGGNNEGYFNFSVISKEDLEAKAKVKSEIKAGTYKPEHSDGVLYSTVYAKAQEADGEEVRPAAEIIDRSGSIKVDIAIDGQGSNEDVVDFIEAMWRLAAIADISPDTVVQAECTVTYDGDEFYPEVYLNGCNLKPGTLDQVAERDYPVEEEIESMFSTHRFSLVPHSTVTFMLNIKPEKINFLNGAGFEIYVPELHAASVLAEIAESKSSESETPGGDTPSDRPDTPEVSSPGSSGGGCEMGFGALTLIGLAGLVLKVRKDS